MLQERAEQEQGKLSLSFLPNTRLGRIIRKGKAKAWGEILTLLVSAQLLFHLYLG